MHIFPSFIIVLASYWMEVNSGGVPLDPDAVSECKDQGKFLNPSTLECGSCGENQVSAMFRDAWVLM